MKTKKELQDLYCNTWPVYKSEETNFHNVSDYLCTLLTNLSFPLQDKWTNKLLDSLTVREALNKICGSIMSSFVFEAKCQGEAEYKSEEEITRLKKEVIKLFYTHFEPNINVDDENLYLTVVLKQKSYLKTFFNEGGWDMIENLRKGTIVDKFKHSLSLYNIAGLLLDLLDDTKNKSKSIYKALRETILFDENISHKMRNLLRNYLMEQIVVMDNLQMALINNPDFYRLNLLIANNNENLNKGFNKFELHSESRDDLTMVLKINDDYVSGYLEQQVLSGDNDELRSQVKILREVLLENLQNEIEKIFKSDFKSDKKKFKPNLTSKEEYTMCCHYYYPLWFQMIIWRQNDSITDKCSFLYDLGKIFGFNTKENLKNNEKLKLVQPYIKYLL